MFKRTLRILCGFSFDRGGHAALDQAMAIARAARAPLCILHGVPSDRPFRFEEESQLAQLRALRRKASQAGIQVAVRVEHADPAEAIGRVAEHDRRNLVVAGRRSGRASSRSTLHRLVASVAGTGSAALLIVPEADQGVRYARSGFRNVVWAVGRSPLSVEAEDAVLRVLHEGHDLTLLNVAQPGGAPRRAAMTRLGQALSEDLVSSMRVRLRVASGAVPETIVRVAASQDADLIVLGAGATGRSPAGSRVAATLELATVPVLVLPADVTRKAAPEARRLARAA